MKNFKTSLLLSTLLLATSSYAETTNNEEIEVEVNTRDQCGYYYRETLSHPLIKRDAAVTIDKEAAKLIQLKRQFADKYIMNADIATFSETGSISDYDSYAQMQDLIDRGHVIPQEVAVKELISLFGYYYLGEYVPKDDYQAIAYLEKLVEYYDHARPEYVDELILGVAMSLDGGISKANPLWRNDDPTQVFNLLIKAGSLDTEVMMIDEDFDSSDADCVKNMLPKIEALADQGSRLAIHRLAKHYKKLSAKGTEADNEKMMYWEQKAEENPLIGIKWSI